MCVLRTQLPDEPQLYRSRQELLVEAVRLLRDSKTGLRRLREQVTSRLARLDRGEAIELDGQSLGQFFDDVETEVEDELAMGAEEGQ